MYYLAINFNAIVYVLKVWSVVEMYQNFPEIYCLLQNWNWASEQASQSCGALVVRTELQILILWRWRRRTLSHLFFRRVGRETYRITAVDIYIYFGLLEFLVNVVSCWCGYFVLSVWGSNVIMFFCVCNRYKQKQRRILWAQKMNGFIAVSCVSQP
jgi:hypothetical protein